MIRVAIADDHHVVRAGLAQLLESADDVEFAGAAGDGEEILALVADAAPDVVLMDLSMPRLDGIAATRRLAAEAPGVRVVVLTSFSDRERILDAIDAGAAGYLLKDAEPGEILAGIRAAARGEAPLDPKAASTVLSRDRDPGGRDREPDRPVELTEREAEVLSLVAEGLPNKLIALRLGISEKTVKAHLTNVFQRLGVTDRTQAALWAQRHGLA